MRSFFPWAIVVAICLLGCSENYRDARTLCISWYIRGLGHMDNPEREFKNAIKADPQYSPPYYWLASYYCKTKRKKESIEYFEKFLQVVDERDPQQKDRIEMAGYFIRELKAGNDEYISIIGKALSKE